MNIRDWFLPTKQLKLIHTLWTVRIAFVGTVATAVYTSFPAFQAYVSPREFLCINVALGIAILIARVTNQSGVDF